MSIGLGFLQEACNLVAKASGEGRASPLVLPQTSGTAVSGGRDPYEPWDMTPRERDISTKYLKFINYHTHTALIETGPPLIPAGAPVARAVKRATNAVNMRASPCAAQTPLGAEVPSR